MLHSLKYTRPDGSSTTISGSTIEVLRKYRDRDIAGLHLVRNAGPLLNIPPSNNGQDHLNLPVMNFGDDADKVRKPQSQNYDGEHLPLPVMNFNEDEESAAVNNNSEHLSLPKMKW